MSKHDPFFPELSSFERCGPNDPLLFYRKPLVGYVFKERLRMGLRLLKERYDAILEIGYGCGLLLPFLSTLTENLFGLDLDADPVRAEKNVKENIRPECALNLFRGNLLAMPFPEKSFSCIITFSTLEHIEAVEDVRRGFLRVARPGAEIIIGMPSVNPWMEWGFHAIGYGTVEDQHVMTPQKLKQCFSEKMELVHHKTLLPPLSLYHIFHFRVPEAPAASISDARTPALSRAEGIR